MADGYALIEINTKGEARLKDECEVHFFDIRLTASTDFDASEGVDQLVDQLPKGTNDVLVMVIFNYRVESSYDAWSSATEYEDFYDIDTFQVVKTDYKEFYRQMVAEELIIAKDVIIFEGTPFKEMSEFEKDKQYYDNLIADWEEFYGEDFPPYDKKQKPKQVERIDGLGF